MLSTVIKDQQKIQAAFEQADFEPERKRMRMSSYEDVEDTLLICFKSVQGETSQSLGTFYK